MIETDDIAFTFLFMGIIGIIFTLVLDIIGLTLYTSFPTFGTELGITFGVFFMIYGWWIKHE